MRASAVIVIGAIVLSLTLASPAKATQSLTLAWDLVPGPDIAGYRLLYGSASGNYPQEVDAGNTTTATVLNLADGSTYFFVVTAYTTLGMEGPPSNEVSATAGGAPTPTSTPTYTPTPAPTPTPAHSPGATPTPSPSASPTLAPIPPSITTQPANRTVTAGKAATFRARAAGTTPLHYHWKKNGTYITGATRPSYTTPTTTEVDNGSLFAVTVSNSAGSLTSNNATLTVIPLISPSITTQPANRTVALGQTATFRVTATGTAPLHYHWKKNGTYIAGATRVLYTTPATTEGDSGSLFAVTVSNSAGSVASTNATLTVIPGPTPNPTPTPTPGATPTPGDSPTPTPTPNDSPTPTSTPGDTPTPTATPSDTPTPTPVP